MENITTTEGLSTGARNKMALMYGAILGLIYVIMCTVSNMMINNMITFYVVKVVSYIIYMVLVGIFARMIRKANGGYIEFREVFGAAFIMLAVAGVMTFIYNYVYMYVIDPDFMNKMKDATLRMMENMKAPDESLDKTAQSFDKQIAEAKKFKPLQTILSLLGSIVLDCLFGLIPCAIVKKPRPIFE